MNITILSDLDDTLMSTNMDQYFPNYFMGLGDALKELGSHKSIKEQVFFAVDQMVHNQDPGKMLSEIFAENFYAPLGTTEQDQKENILNYYRNEYPKLKAVTGVRPDALELVNWCDQHNIPIVIATNPVFPETATRERITWAGLDPDKFPYFTTYDHFHFAKPNMAYYAECLGRLGWPEGKIVMIGDDPMRDIEPMQALGFPTFQIHEEKNGHKDNEGTIAEVKAWLETIAGQPDSEPHFSPEANLAILRSTPAVIDYWLRFLPDEAYEPKPESSGGSLTEIFCLMADLEDEIYLPQWKNLAAHPTAKITAPEPTDWVNNRVYDGQNLQTAFQKFYECRMASLELLTGLIQPAQFPDVDQSTLAELITHASIQDRTFLRQAYDIINI